eukprot:m.830786 g.830786  ORF g.830786 m.830786 type:complete len:173 (+) comp23425_c1_seq17:297-815(+)
MMSSSQCARSLERSFAAIVVEYSRVLGSYSAQRTLAAHIGLVCTWDTGGSEVLEPSALCSMHCRRCRRSLGSGAVAVPMKMRQSTCGGGDGHDGCGACGIVRVRVCVSVPTNNVVKKRVYTKDDGLDNESHNNSVAAWHAKQQKLQCHVIMQRTRHIPSENCQASNPSSIRL